MMGALIFFGLFVFLPVAALVAVGIERAHNWRYVERGDRSVWNLVMAEWRRELATMTQDELLASMLRPAAEKERDARRRYDRLIAEGA